MSVEIERKFLVKTNRFSKVGLSKVHIVQGFLNSNKERVVRVRIADGLGFLTIKGPSDRTGTSRYEWEQELSHEEALALLKLSEPGIIEKYRYLVPIGNHVFEVDEFLNENEGLIVAEIELNHLSETFDKPDWLGKEVTGITKYYNAALSLKPFKNW